MDSPAASKKSMLDKLAAAAHPHHQRVPYLRHLPLDAVAIVLLLLAINVLVWAAAGVVLHFHPKLITNAVLCWTFGLRHALDADHISAIDITTRRLLASGRRSVTVGTFFSLGHSTIVIITCIVVAASSSAITKHFGSIGTTGNAIGSAVSAVFLLVLGAMNVWILTKLVAEIRWYANAPLGAKYPGTSEVENDPFAHVGAGPMARLLKGLFKLIDRPWKMYPLGVLFGLGFDTSSEVALLGIAAVSSASGTSLWLIMIFPVLFTAGMCLIDTTDGAAMSALYSSARLAKDRVTVAYYQTALTGITVLIAAFVGTIQFLSMLDALVPNADGAFWDGVNAIGDHYDVLGGVIVGCFAVFGGLAVALYRPWRNRLDARRRKIGVVEEEDAIAGDVGAPLIEVDDTQRGTDDMKKGDTKGALEQVYPVDVNAGSSNT